MNLKSLSNQELNSKLSTCIQKEREILSDILHLIVEVNRRKLYLDLAYPSLFEYLVKHHGYSAGSAYRRIEAARLMKDIPDLPEKLESGALNLSQVSLVQKSIKLSQNKKQVQISKEEKLTLLTSLENKSYAESQVLVSKILDISVQDQAKIQYQKNGSVRIQMTLSKSQWQKVKQMQELLSNSFPNGNDIPKLLEYLADKVIRQKTAIKQGKSQKAKRVPGSIWKSVLRRDQCCQYKDPKTQTICGSRYFLQADHVKPQWTGGGESPENLQVLCAAHNQYRYRLQSQVRSTD